MSNISKEQLIKELKEDPRQKVKYVVVDMDGVLRGKVVHNDKFISCLESGSSFCDVVLGWDSSDTCYEEEIKFTGWQTGFPDVSTVVDISTYRKVPWDDDVAFFIADFRGKQGEQLSICPRSLLKKVKAETEALGFQSVFAQEFEWFNFQDSSDALHARGFHQPQPITQGMFGYSVLRASQNKDFFNDLFDSLTKFRVPIEGLHTETGPGVYEAAIVYEDVLEAADRAVLFKTGVKEIAYEHGIIPTFMAKWSDDYPGCGGHLHQSLWKDDKNVFYDAKGDRGMSEMMKSYMAGILYCLPHVLPMYAPTTNSFKRLVEGAWAPTTLTWAVDNRTVCLRALPGGKKSTRMELRVPGSDVNPYIAIAASLASGMYGIKHKLKLDQKETKGNGYKDLSNGILPSSLKDASANMKSSAIAKELFGEEFVDHYCKTRDWEWKQADKHVTDWELKRYFEII
jgi:glutamine synthetase